MKKIPKIEQRKEHHGRDGFYESGNEKQNEQNEEGEERCSSERTS
jgi:hypothetical protein